MKQLQREVCVKHGGIWARLWDSVRNLVAGRKLVECQRCYGVGIQKVERIDWRPGINPNDTLCVLTCCNRCGGTGVVWR